MIAQWFAISPESVDHPSSGVGLQLIRNADVIDEAFVMHETFGARVEFRDTDKTGGIERIGDDLTAPCCSVPASTVAYLIEVATYDKWKFGVQLMNPAPFGGLTLCLAVMDLPSLCRCSVVELPLAMPRDHSAKDDCLAVGCVDDSGD